MDYKRKGDLDRWDLQGDGRGGGGADGERSRKKKGDGENFGVWKVVIMRICDG